MSQDGEAGLLDRIAARLGTAPAGEVWAGDDAAAFPSPAARLLCTTDAMVESVDFDLGYCSGDDVGWKAMHVNASDVAAMGGRPTHAVVVLALRGDTELRFIDGFLDGLTAAAASLGVALVGGDLSRAGEIAVTVTLIGAIDDGGPILRSRAKAGEALCVTGSLGGARYGLELLRSGLWRRGGSPEPGGDAAVRERLALRHLRPRARVDAGRVLARMGASAMIDISDGLLLDLSRLLAASGAGCLVDPSEVPVDPDLAAIEAARPGAFPDPLHAALSGGEDFELLFSIDDARLDEVASSLAEVGSPVTRIGTVTDGPPMVGGRALDEWKDTGWDHLREA